MSTRNYEAFNGAAAITCTLTTLAAGSARESAVVANTAAPECFDYLVELTFTIASGSPSTSNPVVNVYANGSMDAVLWPIIQLSAGGTYQTGGGDSSVGALGNPPNVRLIGSFGLATTTSSGERTFRTQPLSVAQAFGGLAPAAFSLIVENQSGVAFSSSTTSTAQYLSTNPIYTTSGN